MNFRNGCWVTHEKNTKCVRLEYASRKCTHKDWVQSYESIPGRAYSWTACNDLPYQWNRNDHTTLRFRQQRSKQIKIIILNPLFLDKQLWSITLIQYYNVTFLLYDLDLLFVTDVDIPLILWFKNSFRKYHPVYRQLMFYKYILTIGKVLTKKERSLIWG